MPRIVLKAYDSERTLEAQSSEATIGRDPACLLLVDGPNTKVVSARHARIFFQDGAWWIEDTSRNGTIVDEERLQPRQRHALKVGQLIGLGESGPRFRVGVLESRQVAETMVEAPNAAPGAPAAQAAAGTPAPPPSTTAPRQGAGLMQRPPVAPPAAEVRTAPLRQSEAARAGVSFEESTEPMSPSPDWLVHIVLRATNTNQHYEIRSQVVKLGRSPECNVQIAPEQGAAVSRIHAEILVFDGGVTVRDSGSRNGTFLNGKRVDTPQLVNRNDLIMLGSGGPTFSVEDLHIVKGKPTPPVPGRPDSGEATPKQARPVGASSPLARHTSYRVEPPTAPAKLTDSRGGAHPRNVFEDANPRSTTLIRALIWVVVAGAVLAAAYLFLGR